MQDSSDAFQREAKKTVTEVVQKLCDPSSYETVYHHAYINSPMPSIEILEEIIGRLRFVLFPGYFGYSEITPDNMSYSIGANVEKVLRLLQIQIRRGFCFVCPRQDMKNCEQCEELSQNMARSFIAALPQIRHMLATDVQAAYEGDPAAKDPGETIYCYPSITALTNYRIAHELYRLGAELIPRIITEQAHSKTGIDIHPGATIDEYFFIDHGSGVVIGETCNIGRQVRLYQGVTLGAKSFPKDESGKLIKGIPRHPLVEDNVTIYSGATLLGRIRIGQGSIIGGNVWLTNDVDPGSKVVQGATAEAKVELLQGRK